MARISGSKRLTMHPNARRAFIEKIIAIARKASLTGEPSSEFPVHFGRHNVDFYLDSPTAHELQQLYNKLLDTDSCRNLFSEKYIKENIEDILADAVANDDPQNTSEQVDELLAEIEIYNKEFLVIVPLVGVRIDNRKLSLGQVVIRRFSGSNYRKISKRIEKIILANTHHTMEEKREHIQHTTEDLSKLEGRVCAEYSIKAEAQRARERAIEEVHRAIDLLYYCRRALHGDDWRVRIGLLGEVSREWRITPVISTNDYAFNISGEVVGPLSEFEISPRTIAIMRKMGVFELSEVLRKGKPTDFEETLLRCIHWYANSQIQVERENELLSLITSLEVLFTRQGASIAITVGESTAFVLAKGLTERKKMSERIKAIHELRSKISHGGNKAINDDDLNYLRGAVFYVVQEMVKRKREFGTKKDLLNWIDDQKLS